MSIRPRGRAKILATIALLLAPGCGSAPPAVEPTPTGKPPSHCHPDPFACRVSIDAHGERAELELRVDEHSGVPEAVEERALGPTRCTVRLARETEGGALELSCDGSSPRTLHSPRDALSVVGPATFHATCATESGPVTILGSEETGRAGTSCPRGSSPDAETGPLLPEPTGWPTAEP